MQTCIMPLTRQGRCCATVNTVRLLVVITLKSVFTNSFNSSTRSSKFLHPSLHVLCSVAFAHMCIPSEKLPSHGEVKITSYTLRCRSEGETPPASVSFNKRECVEPPARFEPAPSSLPRGAIPLSHGGSGPPTGQMDIIARGRGIMREP